MKVVGLAFVELVRFFVFVVFFSGDSVAENTDEDVVEDDDDELLIMVLLER